MAYRNDLDAAHAQVDALLQENRRLREQQKYSEKRPDFDIRAKAQKRSLGTARSGFHYTRPKSFFPLLDALDVLTEDLLSGVSEAAGGALFLMLTPLMLGAALLSSLLFPVMVLSGFSTSLPPLSSRPD